MKSQKRSIYFTIAATSLFLVGLSGCDKKETVDSPKMTPSSSAMTSSFTASSVMQSSITESVVVAIADSTIINKINMALMEDDYLAELNIMVAVSEGEVTLSGVVQTEAQRDQTLLIANGTEGVKRVVDKLVIENGSN